MNTKIIKFLKFFNYKHIGNDKGNTHRVLNFFDFLSGLLYFGFSIYGLFEFSKIILFSSIATLIGLLVENAKIVCDYTKMYVDKYTIYPNLGEYPINLFTAILESCILIFILLPFGIQGRIFFKEVIRTVGFFVALMCLVENIIKNLICAFEASMDLGGGI